MSTNPPEGKTIIDVFADFMRYLFDSTKAFFKASEPGETRWDSISKSVELVLTHPNDWGGPQQTRLRTAAVKAGIVPNTPAGHSRVYLITEGEAILTFCITKTQAGKNLEPGKQALIVNAGDRTIDISAHTVLNNGPLRAKELCESRSLFQGEKIVTMRAKSTVQGKLVHSKFGTPDRLETFSRRFDEGIKKVFSTSNRHTDHNIRFGSTKDNNPKCGIVSGRLVLTGAQVSRFFEPSIQSTVDCIRDNFRRRLPTNSFAFLVGSFATIPWFSEQLQRRLVDLGFQFCKPDDVHTNSAVAIGAVSYYIDHFVTGSVSPAPR